MGAGCPCACGSRYGLVKVLSSGWSLPPPAPADAWPHITARPGASRKDGIAERVVFGMDRMAAAGGTMPKRTRGGIPSGLRPAQRAVIAATSRSNRPGRLGAGSQPAAKRAGRSPPWATAVGERRVAAGLVVVGQWRWNAQSRPVVLPHGAAAASAPPRGGGATHADELRPREGADRDPSPTADRLTRAGDAARGRWGSSAAPCGGA